MKKTNTKKKVNIPKIVPQVEDKRKVGRPSLYTKEIQEKLYTIIEEYNPKNFKELSELWTYPQLARDLGISKTNIFDWVAQYEKNRKQEYGEFYHSIKMWDTLRCAAIATCAAEFLDRPVPLFLFMLKAVLRMQEPYKQEVTAPSNDGQEDKYENLTKKETKAELEKELQKAAKHLGSKKILELVAPLNKKAK